MVALSLKHAHCNRAMPMRASILNQPRRPQGPTPPHSPLLTILHCSNIFYIFLLSYCSDLLFSSSASDVAGTGDLALSSLPRVASRGAA